jgi:hypothetical protein
MLATDNVECRNMIPKRDSFIQTQLQEIGLDSFPDNLDVVWHFKGTRHIGDYSLVEAEPVPSTVGYPRFRFVLRFDDSNQGLVVGCYALMQDVWQLLFSDPSANTEWKGLFS